MSCEIPQSITIKGKPGLYIPLGSPFPLDNRLENHISFDQILEMMGGSEENNSVIGYDYLSTHDADGVEPELQAYVLHYPIIDKWEIVEDIDGDHPLHLFPDEFLTGSFYLKGEFIIKNTLRYFLGEDAEHEIVKAYVYMEGPNNATISLDIAGRIKIERETLSNEAFPAPSSGHFIGTLFPHSILSPPHDEGIEITNDLNDMSAEDDSISVKYTIEIPFEYNIGNVISADLVILLPLKFQIQTSKSNDPPYPDYVSLSLGNVFTELKGEDMFGRKNGEDNDLLNNVDMVKVILKDIENNIIDGSPLALLLTANSYRDLIELNMNEPSNVSSLEIRRDELPNPFSPRFEMLLKKEGKDYATLKIKRRNPGEAPRFDYFMAIEARADIDYTINF
jgi:hypothetical protein